MTLERHQRSTNSLRHRWATIEHHGWMDEGVPVVCGARCGSHPYPIDLNLCVRHDVVMKEGRLLVRKREEFILFLMNSFIEQIKVDVDDG